MNLQGNTMKNIQSITWGLLAALFVSGCTSQQIGQAIYDGIKTTECTQATGEAFCDESSG